MPLSPKQVVELSEKDMSYKTRESIPYLLKSKRKKRTRNFSGDEPLEQDLIFESNLLGPILIKRIVSSKQGAEHLQ